MRRLLRWMIVLAVLVGLSWAAASYEIRGKTPFGHALVWWKKQSFELPFFADKKEPKQKPKKRENARPAAKPQPPPVEKEATAKRVALLEKAARAIEKDPGNPGAKTSVGEKPSSKDKKALDELLSSRVPRAR